MNFLDDLYEKVNFLIDKTTPKELYFYRTKLHLWFDVISFLNAFYTIRETFKHIENKTDDEILIKAVKEWLATKKQSSDDVIFQMFADARNKVIHNGNDTVESSHTCEIDFHNETARLVEDAVITIKKLQIPGKEKAETRTFSSFEFYGISNRVFKSLKEGIETISQKSKEMGGRIYLKSDSDNDCDNLF